MEEVGGKETILNLEKGQVLKLAGKKDLVRRSHNEKDNFVIFNITFGWL